MEKLIWRTVVITISEIWRITWADGTEQTVVYQTKQFYQVLPANPNAPHDGRELTTIEAHSSPPAPVAQTGANETVDKTGDSTG